MGQTTEPVNEKRESSQPPSKWTDPMVILTVILALCTLSQAVLLFVQRQDAVDAGAITVAIKDAQEKTATETARLAKGMADSVTLANDTLAEAKAQNLKSLDQSQRALSRTVEMSRTDLRAWVGCVDPTFTVEKDLTFKVAISMKNFGRTPSAESAESVADRLVATENLPSALRTNRGMNVPVEVSYNPARR